MGDVVTTRSIGHVRWMKWVISGAQRRVLLQMLRIVSHAGAIVIWNGDVNRELVGRRMEHVRCGNRSMPSVSGLADSLVVDHWRRE